MCSNARRAVNTIPTIDLRTLKCPARNIFAQLVVFAEHGILSLTHLEADLQSEKMCFKSLPLLVVGREREEGV